MNKKLEICNKAGEKEVLRFAKQELKTQVEKLLLSHRNKDQALN